MEKEGKVKLDKARPLSAQRSGPGNRLWCWECDFEGSADNTFLPGVTRG
ncbi:MAG: hypothetical protein HY787_07780 [Deltaproteobacteria bacterium]|nr:hypothetical protein [Deltaproteobacteria bacterium]